MLLLSQNVFDFVYGQRTLFYSTSHAANRKTEEQKRQIRAAATKNPAQLYAATNNVLNLDPKTPFDAVS